MNNISDNFDNSDNSDTMLFYLIQFNYLVLQSVCSTLPTSIGGLILLVVEVDGVVGNDGWKLNWACHWPSSEMKGSGTSEHLLTWVRYKRWQKRYCFAICVNWQNSEMAKRQMGAQGIPSIPKKGESHTFGGDLNVLFFIHIFNQPISIPDLILGTFRNSVIP